MQTLWNALCVVGLCAMVPCHGFRKHHTAGHRVGTASLAEELTPRMGLNERLRAGQALSSGSGAKFLIESGDLVLRIGEKVLWTAGAKNGVNLYLQGDGNLVLRDSGGKAAWASGTDRKGATHLVVQSDCNVVLYGTGGSLWSTRTNPCPTDSSPEPLPTPAPSPPPSPSPSSRPSPGPTPDSPKPAPSPAPNAFKPGPNDGFMHSEWNNYYVADNPLNIEPDSKRSNNYFIIMGDWGATGSGERGLPHCQKRVAAMMKDYVKQQKDAGKTLLFIASLGDNFYGQVRSDLRMFKRAWRDMYGSDLTTRYPWLTTLGNHDYGKNDPRLGSPSSSVKVHGQNYGGLQLNSDKNHGKRPSYTKMFWQPDYNYHYSLPAVGLEVISVDCDSAHPQPRGIKNSGKALLRWRGKKTEAKNVLIINHYVKKSLIDEFRKGGSKAEVFLAGGHNHKRVISGETILSGHGGGRPSSGSTYGFVAVRLKDGTGWTTEPIELKCSFASGNLKSEVPMKNPPQATVMKKTNTEPARTYDEPELTDEDYDEDEKAIQAKFGDADDPEESGEEACDEFDNAEEFMSPSELAGAEEDMDFAVASNAPKDILSQILLSESAKIATSTALGLAQHVIFYWGRNACGRTRAFTPELAKAYRASRKAGKETVVVFVSLDRSQEEFDKSFEKMPWFAVPWNFKSTVSRLRRIMIRESVGLPYMYVMNAQGQLITKDRNLYKRFF